MAINTPEPAGLRQILSLHEARAALDLLKTSCAATRLFHGQADPKPAGKHIHLPPNELI